MKDEAHITVDPKRKVIFKSADMVAEIAKLKAEINQWESHDITINKEWEKSLNEVVELKKKLSVSLVLLDHAEKELSEYKEILTQSQMQSNRLFAESVKLKAERDCLRIEVEILKGEVKR